jgi:anti-sigma B factor antagonist
MSLSSDRLPPEQTCPDAPLSRLNVRALSESNVEDVRAQLLALAAGQKDLRLDLGELEYLTSSGLGLFLTLHKKIREEGGRLSLHNVSEFLYELFTVTHLHTVLDVRQTEAEEGTSVVASA